MAQALRHAGVEVVVHDAAFDSMARDEVWLREAGRLGWVVLTKDRNIRYNTLETTALFQSGARVFVLVSGNLSGDEIA